MTRAEALAEAQRRWGPDAYAQFDGVNVTGMEYDYCEVGVTVKSDGKGFHPKGQLVDVLKGSGDTFESAFENADKGGEK